MMGIHPALKCFNKRKCRFLTPCFYVCKRPVSISVKRGFYARKIPGKGRSAIFSSSMRSAREKPSERVVKGRALSLRSFLPIALLISSRLKNWRPLRTVNMERWHWYTAFSTIALSCGLLGLTATGMVP